eukprot:g39699.t1
MAEELNRGLEYKSRDIQPQKSEVLVSPHLEYCEQFWAPYLSKDVLALEVVQRRFTRMILGMNSLSYEEQLRFLATGEVLEDWRVANVVPLFKKGNRDNPGNYRLEVTKVIDEGTAVDVVDMDFSKAFNKVPHGRLIQKIKMLGIH